MRLYADTTALDAYPGGPAVPEADRPALLRTASRMVDELLRGRVYPTDPAGLPTDTTHAEAMSDATCAIVVELHTSGATAPGGATEWDQVSIGTVKLAGRRDTATHTVLGLPVPAAAVVHLSDVGRLVVGWS